MDAGGQQRPHLEFGLVVDRPGASDGGAIEEVFRLLARQYEYILIDAGTQINSVTVAALYTTDTIFLVANPDVPSIRNAQRLLDRVRQCGFDSAQATAQMDAIKGRASFLGDRALGHVDPGSRSMALIIAAVCDSLQNAALSPPPAAGPSAAGPSA